MSHKGTVRSYYAAANSSNGFYSLFGEIFSPERLSKIYILKGGPGCGKSTLIKRISQNAVELGYDVENYYCSSSPRSFDGVIIPKLSVAVTDGTSPHSQDPTYPGACEKIINLGDSWNTEKLYENSIEIRSLTTSKKQSYQRAYAYLSGCEGALSVIDRCSEAYLLESKMQGAIDRLCSKYKPLGLSGKTDRVFTDCISINNDTHLATFEDNSETRYFVKDYGGIITKYMESLSEELTSRGFTLTLALSPVQTAKIVGIYVKDINASITVYNDEYARALDREQKYYKIINMARFCNTDLLKKQRTTYKYAEKAYDILLAGAARELEKAAIIHQSIEDIYYTATDFTFAERKAEELEREIFQ